MPEEKKKGQADFSYIEKKKFYWSGQFVKRQLEQVLYKCFETGGIQ